MSVISNNILAGASGQGGGGGTAAGYQIGRSIRFNSDDSAYLNRTPSAAGNLKTWTWSAWVKRTHLGTQQVVWTAGTSTQVGNWSGLRFQANTNNLQFINNTNNTGNINFLTEQQFTDCSAWMHVLLSIDISNSTADDRVSLFINNVKVEEYSTKTQPNTSVNTGINGAVEHNIAREAARGDREFGGYLADVHFIDGQALDPTSFGAYDTNGVWQAAEYTGTYGTNGFHLDFADNSSNAALGTDTSGNGNTWTVNNITATATSYTLLTSATGTGGVTGINSSQPISKLYDGNTGTYVGTNSANISNNAAILTLTFSPGIPFSSTVRARSYKGTGETVTYNFNGEGSNSWSPTGVDWQTVKSGSGTMTSLVITRQKINTNGGSCDCYGLEIDGVLLVDGNPGDTDSLVDSPINGTQTDTGLGGEISGNYCVWNPLFNSSGTYSNGNLQLLTTAGNRHYQATIGLTSGKWYWEIEPDAGTSVGMIGIALGSKSVSSNLNGDSAMSYYGVSGNKQGGNTSGVDAAYGASFTYGDIIGVALDLDSGTKTLTFYKNGVSQGVAFNPDVSLGAWFPAVSAGSSVNTTTFIVNFGQRPFAYPLSGYKCINTASLPTPTIEDGSQYFDTKLYSGTGSSQNITGLNFSPDFSWLKARSSGTTSHNLYDNVRGATKVVYSDSTSAENTAANGLTAFNSDGFSLGSAAATNASGATYVSWNWDAGTSTVSNTDGTITSQVRAQPSAGFSIVSYTGTNTFNASVGHGLNATPKLILIKNRDAAADWRVYTTALDGSLDRFVLNSGDGKNDSTQDLPTNLTFSITNGVSDGDPDDYVAYCFAPVAGYSAIGSYIGNGNANNGPFCYTGFKVAWLLIKKNGSSTSWQITDSARSPYNVAKDVLKAGVSSIESTQEKFSVDFLSNGFKQRTNNNGRNGNGATYLYLAFAENPFSSNGGIVR